MPNSIFCGARTFYLERSVHALHGDDLYFIDGRNLETVVIAPESPQKECAASNFPSGRLGPHSSSHKRAGLFLAMLSIYH